MTCIQIETIKRSWLKPKFASLGYIPFDPLRANFSFQPINQLKVQQNSSLVPSCE